MSEEKSRVDTLMGTSAGTGNGDIDWKAKCADLENKLNSARVEAGRVKKLDEELKNANAELAKLREKNAGDELMADLSEDEREAIPEEVLRTTAKMVRRAQDESDRRLREMEERRQADSAAERKARIERFIDANYPKFWSDVSDGGDKAEAWGRYKTYNAASLNDAFGSGNADAIRYHIENFYNNHLGIPAPSVNREGSASPDPAAHGGGTKGGRAISGKTYTSAEFMALYDAVEVARDRGDWEEKKRLEAEIKAAPAEGRVKD